MITCNRTRIKEVNGAILHQFGWWLTVGEDQQVSPRVDFFGGACLGSSKTNLVISVSLALDCISIAIVSIVSKGRFQYQTLESLNSHKVLSVWTCR
jgi:hypothetical protein